MLSPFSPQPRVVAVAALGRTYSKIEMNARKKWGNATNHHLYTLVRVINHRDPGLESLRCQPFTPRCHPVHPTPLSVKKSVRFLRGLLVLFCYLETVEEASE